MAGYTRQSTFADGDTITAALFNNEFNQLLNAFSNTSGHKHDGTANEGPVIGLIGDAGETSPNNKVLIDTTNNYIEFYVEVSSAPVQQLYIADGAIIPVTDSDIDLGTTSLRFKDTYTDTVTTTGNVSIGGDLTVTGSATISGNLTFGDADTDSINLAAEIDSDIIPNTDGTYDLGSATKEWQDLYIDGTANIDSLVADTADINGGTIDGATIATSDITVGAGKTLDVSSGTLTLADDQISGDKVEGGTIAATTVTTLTSTTGNITNVNATTLDTTNIEVTNLKAKDGTSAGSIADSTGVVTLASSVLTTADINGGTIDGTTIATSDITVGSGKTLNVSAGTLTLADNQISGDKVEGGTIAATTITDLTFGSLNDGSITITAFVDEDDMTSNSATLVPTQQSVKAYVDSQVTAQDLDFQGDTGGALSIDLDSESLTIAGGAGLDTVGSGNTVTVNIDSTVATLTGTQTLTNKTLTSPDVNTPDIDGGTIDSTVIGGATPAAGTFTTLTANTSITGTLATAAQPNITSLGTLTGLNVAGTPTFDGLTVDGTGSFTQSSNAATALTTFTNSNAGASARASISFASDTGSSVIGTVSSGWTVDALNANETFMYGSNGVSLFAPASQNVRILAGGSERMRIDSSGRVGIGTANYNGLKTVIKGETGYPATSGTTQTGVLRLTGGTGLYNVLDMGVNESTDAAWIQATRANSLSTYDKLLLNPYGGNVGIGTSSPSQKLDVDSGHIAVDAGYGLVWSGDADRIITPEDNSIGGLFKVASAAATRFMRGSNESMRIDSSGNLGIGVSSVGRAPLHVHQATDNTDANIHLTSNETGSTGSDGFSISVSGAGADDLDAYLIQRENANLRFYTNATERMRIDSSGNVGIGGSPTNYSDHKTLSLYGNTGTGAGFIEFNDTSGNADAVIFSDDGNLFINADYDNTAASSSIRFRVDGSSEKMRIDSSGNVGINTSSPTSYANSQTALVIEDTSSPAIVWSDTGQARDWFAIAQGSGLHFNYADGGGSGGASNVTNVLVLDNSGNVGIGTDSPSDTLDIERATGVVSLGLQSRDSSDTKINFGDNNDGNVGIINYAHSDNSMRFTTNASERMRIDSSGHVVIQDDTVYTTNAPTYRGSLILAGASGGSSFGGIEFHTNAGGGAGYGTKITASDAVQTFLLRNNSTTWSESMRIASTGNLLVGNSYDAFNARANIYASGSGTSTITLNLWNGGGSGCIYERYVNSGGAAIGSITQNGASAVSFNTSSDARLKDVTGEARGLEVINELNPVAYNWKADGKADEGLIAQEVLDIVPNAVSGSEEDYYQMDYSKLVVHLVAGMKEQQAQIEALQSEINELKNS